MIFKNNNSIEKNNTHSSSYYYLGLSYYSAGLYDNAVNMLEECAKLDESNREIYMSLSSAYSALGDSENSIIAFNKYKVFKG